MTESSIENLIQDYLDSVFVISHSHSSVDSYRFGINHFKKFVQTKYEKSLEQTLSAMKDNSMDRYKVLKDFVIYLDKEGKKPASIQIWVVGAKGFLKHCGIKIYSEDFKMSVRLPKRIVLYEEVVKSKLYFDV